MQMRVNNQLKQQAKTAGGMTVQLVVNKSTSLDAQRVENFVIAVEFTDLHGNFKSPYSSTVEYCQPTTYG